MRYQAFVQVIIDKEKAAWLSFVDVIKNFLENKKAGNHENLVGRPTIRPGLAGTVPEFKVLSRSAERKSRFFMESAGYASLLRQKFSY